MDSPAGSLTLYLGDRIENGRRVLADLTEGNYESHGLAAIFRIVTRPDYWDGRSVAGKTLLLTNHSGMGDLIQLLRYARAVKALCGRLVLSLDGPCTQAAPLAALCSAVDEVLVREPAMDLPAHDLAVPLFELPIVFGSTQSTLPDARWISSLPPRYRHDAIERVGTRGLKIGLVWAGTGGERDCSLARFAPLACIPGVRLFSLQRGPGAEQRKAADFPIADLQDADADILHTAACMRAMDLVISVDSMTCHLAATLGVPTFTLLPANACVRWLRGRSDSPWYAEMTLFRQATLGDWSQPVSQVTERVREIAAVKGSR